ncbi:outer membrane beta-barrel protein [Ectothiorhodospiraceae bacterium WFHF3C12]|nr:outer membrane beta-barrel protein [Ectothiorhodospiraceae bacterium WFHF3C12]
MLKKTLGTGFLAAALSLPGVAQAESAFHGNVHALFGYKQLNDGDFDDLQDQAVWGAMFDFRVGDWPVNIALDALVSASAEDENDVETGVATLELSLGVRKYFDFSSVAIHPFVGGGVSRIGAGIDIEDENGPDEDDSDGAFGGYLTAGAVYTIREHVNLGAIYRYSHAEVELLDEDYNVGGHNLMLMAGYRW